MTNALETRRGRLATFFFLYMTEGIPWGFTVYAVVAQMRRQGLGPAASAAFAGAMSLPWAWKCVAGPVVDICYSDRFGRRRVWIVACQILMAATLMAGMSVDFARQLPLFTAVLLIHNFFAAIQDVAIDALACDTLPAEERGLANGMMFAGHYVGIAIGGSGVLFLQEYFGNFRLTFVYVASAILLVTATVSLRIKEKKREAPREETELTQWQKVRVELKRYFVTAFGSFFGTRLGFFGLVFALLPSGSYALASILRTNLAVDMGLSDSNIGWLTLNTTVISAVGCVVGGRLSDIHGRRFSIAVFIGLTSLPVLILAIYLYWGGWNFVDDFLSEHRPDVRYLMVRIFWLLCLAHAFVFGLMYGTRTALFMDLVRPEIAATQFTAYMALLNVVNSYTAFWQGAAIEHWGYPATLALDGIIGLVCLGILPLLRPANDE